MIDKPLYGNPLAGGGGTLDRLSNKVRGGLSFRQEGDMGRYVADNDPGGIAAGYSNLKDYLAAGNQLPQLPIGEPLKGVSQDVLGNPNIIDPNPIFKPKSDDPLMQGYFDSEFYKGPAMTADVVKYNYQGKPVSGSGSFYGGFKQYLDSVGKGDLLKPDSSYMTQLPVPGFGDNQLNTTDPGPLGPPILDGTPSVNPIVTGPQEIATQDATNPYDRVGQQLMGPNQDDILGTLKNIEQGIASLGQGGMNQSSFGGFNNNFGIGSFFPPYGGMYG